MYLCKHRQEKTQGRGIVCYGEEWVELIVKKYFILILKIKYIHLYSHGRLGFLS